MKIVFFLLPVIALETLSNHSTRHFLPEITEDTTGIVHLLDGNTVEWPGKKFETDKETKINYAVDNDNQTLFLALRISNKQMQQKIMQQGMNLFIDAKGKKKEIRGVEFPVTLEASNDPINNLVNMKLFGFTSLPPFAQNVKTQGTINIACAWDTVDVMHIEYNIPLKFLNEFASALNNTNISVGWKINERDNRKDNNKTDSKTEPAKVVTTLVGIPSGGGRPITRNVSSTNANSAPQLAEDKFIKPQTFWTSYTIRL